MNQFLARLRRANAVLATLLDRLTSALQTARRAQTAAVIAASVVVSLVVASVMAGARHERESWGSTSRVIVSSRPLEAGESLDATNTRTADAPIGFVADDALTEIPAGATVRIALAPHTMVTQSMISGVDQSVDVPEGWRVVAMAIDVTAPALVPGDTVDVVSTDSVVASGAIVIAAATDTQGPSIAVPQDVAAVVATAAREGTASLVLAG